MAFPALEVSQFRPVMLARWQRWRGRLLSLLAGQSVIQLLGFATGLLLLRWMSVQSFAEYGVAFGFQCMFGLFVDLGVGASIVSLVGTRADEPKVLGAYIAAARWWRGLLMILLIPVAAVSFYSINQRQHWPLATGSVLFGCIAISLYVSGWNAWASAPLLIHQQISRLYRNQIVAALLRLAACGGLYLAGQLNAVTLTLVNTALAAALAWSYWRIARFYVQEPPRSSPVIRREMRVYIAPLLPTAIFYALQGQLSTLLISYFGQSQNIAEVAALGRLGQLFTFLGAIYSALIVPYFARLPRQHLAGRYLLVASVTLLLGAGLSLAAFAFPEPLLWVLGHRYAHLHAEIGWMVLGSALNFASASLWSIHCARKWIFWSGSFLYIGLVVLTQAVFMATVDLRTTLHVLYLAVATNITVLAVQFVTAWLGFRTKENAPGPPPHAPALPGEEAVAF